MKMKEFGPPGGGARPWRPPLDCNCIMNLVDEEVVKSTSLSQCSCSVSVIVINQNCQKWGHFRADPQFFQADMPFFAAESFLPYIICIRGFPVM